MRYGKTAIPKLVKAALISALEEQLSQDGVKVWPKAVLSNKSLIPASFSRSNNFWEISR